MSFQQPPPPRRRTWVLPAAIGGVLLVGVLAAAAAIAGPSSSRWSDEDTVTVSDASGLDALFEPAAAGEDAPAARDGDRPLRGPRGKAHRLLRLDEGEKVVAGAVGSVADGTLVVRKDNGAEVSVPTDGDTKVAGPDGRELSDLQAGARVIVKVGADGKADGVLTVRAHAAGTVTALDGDRATVVRPGGLSTVLDLSGVSERPAVGTTVVAVGTATDNGATLKVERLKELATLG